jgi:hypothetical protein
MEESAQAINRKISPIGSVWNVTPAVDGCCRLRFAQNEKTSGVPAVKNGKIFAASTKFVSGY